MIFGWIVSDNPMIGLKICSFEILTKMLLYYAHDQVWFKVNFWIAKSTEKKFDNYKLYRM